MVDVEAGRAEAKEVGATVHLTLDSGQEGSDVLKDAGGLTIKSGTCLKTTVSH